MLKLFNFLKGLFFKTLTVNVLIDFTQRTIKGYVDGIKVLNIQNFIETEYNVGKFEIRFSENLVIISFNKEIIFSSNKINSISLLYSDRKISINGFIIKNF